MVFEVLGYQEAAKEARRPLSEAGRPLAEHVGS